MEIVLQMVIYSSGYSGLAEGPCIDRSCFLGGRGGSLPDLNSICWFFFFCRQNILHKRFFNWSGKLSWGQEEAGILARAPHSLNLGSKLGVGIQFYCGILSKIIVLIGLNYVFILSGQRDLEHLRLHEMRSNEGKEDMWV